MPRRSPVARRALSPAAACRRWRTGLSALLAGLWAAGAAADEISMQLDFVAWGDDVHGLKVAGHDEREFTARSFTYSDTVPYRGPRLLEIHTTGAGAPPDDYQPTAEDLAHALVPLEVGRTDGSGERAEPRDAVARELERRREEEPGLVALAMLPADSRRATVLLAPARDGTYRAYVINDDPATLRPGQLRVHNLSPYPVAMGAGGRPPAEIRTQGSHTIAADSGQVIYELAYQRDGQWIPQEHNIIPVRPNEQTQMIILRSGHHFFLSGDGSTGGFLQAVVLRRLPSQDDS